MLLNHDNAPPAHGNGSSSGMSDDEAPFVVSKHAPSTAAAGAAGGGRSSRRASSVVSLSSSSLTDPDDLEVTAGSSFANASRAKSTASITSHADTSRAESEEEEEEAEDDDIVEVNQDGSEKPLLKIKKLLSNPPREPKNRWETAVS